MSSRTKKKVPELDDDELEYAKLSKNSLYLYLDCSDDTAGTTEINSEIVAQTIKIVSTRILFADGTVAAANPVIYLKLEGWGPNQLNNNLGLGLIPIFTDTTKADFTFYPNIHMSLNKVFRKKFKWSLVDADSAPIADNIITMVQVLFEFEINSI